MVSVSPLKTTNFGSMKKWYLQNFYSIKKSMTLEIIDKNYGIAEWITWYLSAGFKTIVLDSVYSLCEIYVFRLNMVRENFN